MNKLSGKNDPLYLQVVNLIQQTQNVSLSLVQRHFKIDYLRVARMVEDMEQKGLVSGVWPSGQREWLGSPLRTLP